MMEGEEWVRALSPFQSAEGREEECVTVNEPQGLNTGD